MAQLKGVCPKCGGQVYLDGDERKCLQCGLAISSNRLKKAYYQLNRDAIIKTYQEVGSSFTRKRWGISFSSLYKLIPKELIQARSSPVPKRSTNPGSPAVRFPPFSDNWAPEVQIAWFKTYLSLQKK